MSEGEGGREEGREGGREEERESTVSYYFVLRKEPLIRERRHTQILER